MSNQELTSIESSQWLRLLNSTPAIIAAYLAMVTLAELLVTFSDPRLGLLVHALLLSGIVLHIVFVWQSSLEYLLLPMVFVPLIRLMSLSLPLAYFDRIYWYFIVSVPIFAIMPMLLKQLKYSWEQVGFHFRHPRIQVFTILSGFALGYLEYIILRPRPFIDELTFSQFIVPALILFFCTGLFEELIFRGIMQQAAEDALGKWGALLFSAFIFTALHIGYQSYTDLVFVFFAGAFWGLIFMHTRSIIGTTIAHGITNIMLFLVVPFLFFAPAPERPAGASPVIDSGSQSAIVELAPELDVNNGSRPLNIGFIIGISVVAIAAVSAVGYNTAKSTSKPKPVISSQETEESKSGEA